MLGNCTDKPPSPNLTCPVMPSGPTGRWMRSHIANPALRAALRSPAQRGLSDSLLLLDYSSRRSGRHCVFPVQYAVTGDGMIIVAGEHRTKTWWRHFDDHPQPVIAHLHGRARNVMARTLIADSDERSVAVAAFTWRFPKAEVAPDSPVLVLSESDSSGGASARA